MKKKFEARTVISADCFRLRLPVIDTIVMYLFLDKLNSPGWVWGIAGTLFAIIWILAIIDVITRKEINIFTDAGWLNL